MIELDFKWNTNKNAVVLKMTIYLEVQLMFILIIN